MTGNNNLFFGNATGSANSNGGSNSFYGNAAGTSNFGGNNNAFFGSGAGSGNQSGDNNLFLGVNAGGINGSGSNNTVIGANANFSGGATNLTHAAAIGADSTVLTSDTIALGRLAGTDTVFVYGRLKIASIAGGGSTTLCYLNQEIAICSSSVRYKMNIGSFNSGLSLVNRLRPVTFDWKGDGKHDLGLVAEEVAAIEPLLATYNKDGQIEGVKYDRIGVVLLNAVKEQQTQIEAQTRQLAEQKALINGLKKLVCSNNPTAAVCQ